VLDALGEWGAAEPAPADGSLSPGAVLMFLRGLAREDPSTPAGLWGVVLDGQPWSILGRDDTFEIMPGAPAEAESVLETDPATLNALLVDPRGLEAALADGRAQLHGSNRPPIWLFVSRSV
jgi:hypothetical protein